MSQPIRIGLFHADIPHAERKPGGAAVYVARLADALAESGHDVEMWCYEGAPAHRGVRLKRLGPRWLGTQRIPRHYVAPLGLNLRSTGHLDVLHLFGDDWFFVRRRVPTVRTMLGSALMEAVTATSVPRRVESVVIFALEQLSACLADAVYGIGVDSQSLYRGDGILASGIAPIGQPQTPAEHPTILFVGAWEGRKRGSLLQRVFVEEVRPRVPGAQLWMVSNHAEPADGVRWFERPSDAELRGLYQRAWTFCLPSSYEGFGLPYLEALAHGLDVIASPNFGALSLLRGAGRIVEDASLGDALVESLCAPAAEWAEIAGAARRRAADYSWPAIVAAHEAAYRLAIERHAARASGARRSAAAWRT